MGMLLIRNAHLIDGETDRMGDLLILDGRIVKIADKLDCPADETVDVGGWLTCMYTCATRAIYIKKIS